MSWIAPAGPIGRHAVLAGRSGARGGDHTNAPPAPQRARRVKRAGVGIHLSDGTRNDIGFTGGPEAPTWQLD